MPKSNLGNKNLKKRLWRDFGMTASGAGLGAIIGTFVFPGIGTAIGAGIGAAAGLCLSNISQIAHVLYLRHSAHSALKIQNSNKKTTINQGAIKELVVPSTLLGAGIIGAVIGTFVFPVIGTAVGAAIGVAIGLATVLLSVGILKIKAAFAKTADGAQDHILGKEGLISETPNLVVSNAQKRSSTSLISETLDKTSRNEPLFVLNATTPTESSSCDYTPCAVCSIYEPFEDSPSESSVSSSQSSL